MRRRQKTPELVDGPPIPEELRSWRHPSWWRREVTKATQQLVDATHPADESHVQLGRALDARRRWRAAQMAYAREHGLLDERGAIDWRRWRALR